MIALEYPLEQKLVQLLVAIDQQLGSLSKPVRGLQANRVYLSGDIEKLNSDKFAELTDIQNYSGTDTMNIQRISATH
jgi:hypothetical protein